MPEQVFMNSRRLKILWMPLAVVTAAATVAACSSSASSGGKSNSNSNATFTTIGYVTEITPGAPMNPFNATNNIFPSFDAMELAWNDGTAANPNAELPGLASSWSVSADGTQVTAHIQSGAKWSNGKPVTATDVQDSAAIWIALGLESGLASVTVDNPTTVTFNEIAGVHSNTFEQILGASSSTAAGTGQWIVPSFEYGKLLPSNIWSTIAASLGKGSAATAAQTTLTNLGKTITAYAPATDISAGPFYIKRLNNSEALLVKNPDFYAASSIHVGQVVMLHYTGPEIENYLEAGKLDAAPFVALNTSAAAEAKAAGNVPLNEPTLTSAGLVFDENTAPYNNVKVRQALAYVINRPDVQKIGEPAVGTPDDTVTGVANAAVPGYLPSAQSALNQYAPSTAMATTLLKGAGFTQKGGNWYLPNGKPWTINLPVPQGFSDWMAASSAIKSELTSFGIPTTITLEGQWPQYQDDNLFVGKYPVGWWIIGIFTDGAHAFGRIYGTYDGYVDSLNGSDARYPSGTNTSDNFINSPATVSVPGLGTVNPGQLTAQLSQLSLTTSAGQAQQQQIGGELVKTINYEVPVIGLWDYTDNQFVNETRFSDFPTNPNLVVQDAGVWMAEGYVQPK
jgi:peptide/nickel transport system substrate-binding protein